MHGFNMTGERARRERSTVGSPPTSPVGSRGSSPEPRRSSGESDAGYFSIGSPFSFHATMPPASERTFVKPICCRTSAAMALRAALAQ